MPRKCAPILLALALVGSWSALTARPASADALTLLERDWLVRLTQRRPELALRLGAPARADRLLPITDVSLSDDAAWLAAFERRLRAVRPELLTLARRADRDGLLSWCERERVATSERGAWRRDPLAHVARLERALREPFEQPGSACKRANAATGRMRAVPELLRGAQIALDRMDARSATIAAVQLDTLLARMRGELAARAGECRDGPRFADFVEADTLALRSAQRFLDWLRDPGSARTPGTGDDPAMPVDSLPRLSWSRP